MTIHTWFLIISTAAICLYGFVAGYCLYHRQNVLMFALWLSMAGLWVFTLCLHIDAINNELQGYIQWKK